MPIDLDAMRAARDEVMTDRPRPQVVFGGETFDLPHELPFAVFLRLGEMRRIAKAENVEDKAASLDLMSSIMHDIFGDDTERFLAQRPSFDDIAALLEALFDQYELDAPESPAPPSQ